MGPKNTSRDDDRIIRSFDGDGKPPERKGFSLIELMVVVALIGILAAIAFLSMLHYRMTIRANSAARDLAGHMRIAKASAVRGGSYFTFKFIIGSSKDGFSYGVDGNLDGVIDGRTRTEYFPAGIRYGYMEDNIAWVPGHPPAPDCPVMTTAHSAAAECLGNGEYIHFNRNGSAMETRTNGPEKPVPTTGVAYLIPAMDKAGTGARDDRMRAVDWTGGVGKIRMWSYKSHAHQWR